MAPVGTCAVMSVDELTWNEVSDVPLKLTLVAPLKFDPWMSTCVPAEPLVGLKDVTTGRLGPLFVQLGNLKAPMRVCQFQLPFDVRYSPRYQNVQSSTGSTETLV